MQQATYLSFPTTALSFSLQRQDCIERNYEEHADINYSFMRLRKGLVFFLKLTLVTSFTFGSPSSISI